MSRVIEVHKCTSCPFYKERYNKPYCTRSEDGVPRMIPFERLKQEPDAIFKTVLRFSIPEWCPLDDSEDFAESNFDIDRKF